MGGALVTARLVVLMVGLVFSGLSLEPASGQSVEAAGDPVSAAAHRARGLEHGYNLDRDEALAAFEDAIAADPGDPAAYRLAAATVWTQIVFEQGAISVEDYLGQAKSTLSASTAAARARREISPIHSPVPRAERRTASKQSDGRGRSVSGRRRIWLPGVVHRDGRGTCARQSRPGASSLQSSSTCAVA